MQNAAELQGSKENIYIRASNDVNGKDHWISRDGVHALWYEDQGKNWMVGARKDIGKDLAGLFANGDIECPEKSESWNHFDGTNWQDAAEDVQMNCLTEDILDDNNEDECCDSLELSLENDANQNQGQRAGKYEISDDKVGGRNTWKRDDDKYVIWFNSQDDQWTIGSSVGSGGGLFGPSKYKCPGEVGNDWTYYVLGSDNVFLGGSEDISLKCEGM